MGQLKKYVYVALSAVVAAPAFLDSYLRSEGNLVLWYLLGIALILVWTSYPRYNSRWLTWPAYGLTALVVGNAVLSAGWGLAYGEPSPTLQPNLNERLRFTPQALPPGVVGDQIVTTDGHGYRTNVPIDYHHKESGTLRVVAIGASTTEEAKLDDHKTWTYLMGQELAKATGKRIEVINTALSGVRAEQNYHALIETESLEPDVITFILGINDWNHAILIEDWSPAYRFAFGLKAMGFGNSLLFRGLKALKTEAMAWLHPVGPSTEHLYVNDGSFTAGETDSLDRPKKRDFRPATVDPDYAKWVDRIMDECRDKKLPCVFADQPTAYSPAMAPDLRPLLWMTPPFADYTLRLDDLVRLAGLYNGWLAKEATSHDEPFCPLANSMPPTTEVFVDDCHFNDEGARRIARMMTACALARIEKSGAK